MFRLRKYTEWIEEASRLYEQGMKYYQIAKKLGVDRKVVSYRLREIGYQSDQRYVRNVPVEKLRKYDYTQAERVFNKIDSEEKAYWLGFLYADGNVDLDNNTVSIALAEEDLNHVKRFANFMGLSNKKLHKKIRNLNGKKFVSYEFSATSKTLKEQLIKLKCYPKKTYTLSFPSYKIVPRRHMKDFVRGYIDGDGSVTNGTTSVIVLDVLGTKEFIEGYQKWTGLHQNKIHSFVHTDSVVHSMYSGIAAIYILDIVYENATVYLERKHSRYLALRRLRLKTIRRPKSIIAEFSKKGLSRPNLRLKALLKEVDSLQ